MESDSISYETVFHTMQNRGFAAIYDCYLIFMTRVVLFATQLASCDAASCESGWVFLLSMPEQISDTERKAQ
jgi:hypothetical protein